MIWFFVAVFNYPTIGLLHAVDKFDPEKGFRFSTYGAWWIQQNIERAIMNHERTVRLPIHVFKKLNKFIRLIRDLTKKLDHVPTLNEISNELKITPKEVENLYSLNEKTYSLDVPIKDYVTRPFMECIPDERCQDPFNLAAQLDIACKIEKWVDLLSSEQQQVIARRFGILGFDSMTLESTSEDLGLTREKVRHIQIEALKKLKVFIEHDGEDLKNLLS